MTRLLYTVAMVAEQLACSPRQVHRLLSAGELPYVRQGSQRKVRHDALVRYIDSLDGPRRSENVRPLGPVRVNRGAKGTAAHGAGRFPVHSRKEATLSRR